MDIYIVYCFRRKRLESEGRLPDPEEKSNDFDAAEDISKELTRLKAIPEEISEEKLENGIFKRTLS